MEGEWGEEPDDGRIAEEGDGTVSIEMEDPFSFLDAARSSHLTLIAPELSKRIRAIRGIEASGVTMKGSLTRCSIRMGLSCRTSGNHGTCKNNCEDRL